MFKVKMYQGLGDTFYQRPFVKELAGRHPELAVATPYPELHWDIPNLKFWYQPTMIRHCEKEMELVPKTYWAPIHKRLEPDFALGYGHREFFDGLNIVQAYEKIVPLSSPYSIDFPLKPEWIEKALKILNGKDNVCVLRKPTRRRDFDAPSRNPEKGLMPKLVEVLRKEGFYILSVGDLEKNEEDAEEEIFSNEQLERGELRPWEIAALLKCAALTLSPVGFAVPMASAVNAKAFIVFGGHVKPELIYDPRMNLSRQVHIAPTPFCNCIDLEHRCKKDIPYDYAVAELTKFIALE